MRRWSLPCLLLAAAQAVPVFAQEAPGDIYNRAVAARLAGDAATAADLLRGVVAAEPANADAQVQFGFSLLALNRLDEAERAFKNALHIAPTYADARVGLARIAEQRGDKAAALHELDHISQPSPEAQALRQRLQDAPASELWQADFDGSYSSLAGPISDWKEVSVQLRRQSGAGHAISGRVEYSRRFDMDDVYGEILVERKLSDAARGYVSFGATASPDFRAKYQVGLGGSLRVRDGGYATVLTIDAKQSRFANGDVQSVSPGLEQYVKGVGWLTARWINLFDERGKRRSGYMVRADVQALPALRLFAGTNKAPDTDEGTVVQVKGVFGGVIYDLSDRTVLRASISYDDRETGTDRTQVGLGIGVRF